MMVKSYKNLKVGQYIQIQSIKQDLPGLEKKILKACIILGKDIDYYENTDFDKIPTFPFLDELKMPHKVKKRLFINGTIYVARTKVKEFTPKTWGSIMHYRTDTIKNIHHILAWIYKPVFTKEKDHDVEKTAQVFYDHANLADVYGCFFLFSKVLRKWKAIMEFSIQQSATILTEHLRELESERLINTTDGTILSNGLSVTHPE